MEVTVMVWRMETEEMDIEEMDMAWPKNEYVSHSQETGMWGNSGEQLHSREAGHGSAWNPCTSQCLRSAAN